MGKIYKRLGVTPLRGLYLTAFSILSKVTFLYVFTIDLYRIDNSGASSAVIVLLSLVAVSLSGLVSPYLLRKFKGPKLGVMLSYFSLVVILTGYFIFGNRTLIYVSIVVLYLIQGIESANFNYQIVKMYTPGSLEQTKANNGYHVLIEFFSMLGPIIGYVFVTRTSNFSMVLVVVFLQLIGLFSWRYLSTLFPEHHDVKNDSGNNEHTNIFVIYKNVLKNKPVVYLNVVRASNGFIFNIWSATIPLIIAALGSGITGNISWLQTSYEIVASVSFIIAGYVLGNLLNWFSLLTYVYRLVPFVGIFGIVLAVGIPREWTLYLATAILGVGVYFFRVGTATIGQTITEPELIAESIVFGDVFSRTINFVTTSVFFVLIKHVPFEFVIIAFAVVGAFLNMVFINKPLKTYEIIKNQQLKGEKQ